MVLVILCWKRWKCSEFPTVFASSFPVCTIDWSLHNLSSGPDSYPTLVATLRNGRHDRIQLPNLRHRCTLNVANLDTNFPLSSCDADRIFSEMSNIKELCLKNDVRVAMDATTACHLMSNPFVGHNYSYCIPIRVTEEMVHGTMTNITIMGKPRPLEAVEPCSTQRQIVKYLLKSTYVHKKEPASIPKDSRPKSSNDKPKDQSSYDPLDSILNSLDTLSSQSESSAGAAVSDNGRSYSIFSILGSRLLIRSRPAPLCAEGNQNLKGATLSFQPKMEYVPNAGATRLSDEEATWNYCKAIFKQSSNHALFRSHFMGTDVLQIQCWESQSFAVKSGSDLLWTGPTLKQEARRVLSAYTTRFSRLLEELNHLSPGDYMLMNNNDGFIRVLPQANTQS
ncbi:unnamed protein product [Nippostrongylus brasiliensis]|uniref:SH2 domain-containing protein n=1 Tax=Nippostrongylus brasiliensis TaxID=27835 RepID=A0A0N4YYR8_NIPBR|nr:unnamed protein product [Nippostrongylus brasiliensis]